MKLRSRGRRLRLAATLLATTMIVGCKPKPATVPEQAAKTWPEMGASERAEHMTNVVMPRMRAHFQAFDSVRFAEFGCQTCHGAEAARGRFEIPNPALPRLSAKGLFKQHRKENPEITHFMWKTVEPEMSRLLGLPRAGLTNEGGFECGNCHLVEGD